MGGGLVDMTKLNVPAPGGDGKPSQVRGLTPTLTSTLILTLTLTLTLTPTPTPTPTLTLTLTR